MSSVAYFLSKGIINFKFLFIKCIYGCLRRKERGVLEATMCGDDNTVLRAVVVLDNDP